MTRITLLFLLAGIGVMIQAQSNLSQDMTYWRGESELEPGTFLCETPAATGVTVVCDRWPDGSDLRQFGSDAIRLCDAQNPMDSLIAVWRWVRRWTMYTDGNPPNERRTKNVWSQTYGGMVQEPIKVLNVYGTQDCDGLTRAVEAVWRSLGFRAEKYVRVEHTMAHCYYRDTDGIERWHAFDVSEGGYRLNNTRERLLGANGLGCETYYAGWVPGQWVHCDHVAFPRHRTELSFRKGEKLERLWGNLGKPYQSNIRYSFQTVPIYERGPYGTGTYRVDYGNGTWTYAPDLSDPSWTEGLAEAPVQMASGLLRPAMTGQAGSAVWHFRTPYIVSNAEVKLYYTRVNAGDSIRLLLSVDDGVSYQPLWTCSTLGVDQADSMRICSTYTVTSSSLPPVGFNSPFGLYAYRLKLELLAADQASDCEVTGIEFRTLVQQNLFSLPQLQPGLNHITVKGTLAAGTALKVTYVWDDPEGDGRRNITVVENTPYTYDIAAAGDAWDSVVCQSISVEAIAATGEGNHTLEKESPATVGTMPEMMPASGTRKRWQEASTRPSIQPTETVLANLRALGPRGLALDYLLERPDTATFAVVESLVYVESRSPQKEKAVIVLYLTDPERARPILLNLITTRSASLWVSDAHWLNTGLVIAHQAEQQGWSEFSGPIAAMARSVSAYDQLRWAFFRILCNIGNADIIGHVRLFASASDWDVRALALCALARAGDTAQTTAIRNFFDASMATPQFKVGVMRSMIGMGWLKDETKITEILANLSDGNDENIRAGAAEALGHMMNTAHIPALEAAIVVEPFEWVRTAMQVAIDEINGIGAEKKMTGSIVPTELTLFQNVPNPFNPATTIRFFLPVSGRVTMTLCTISGKRVARLLDEERKSGSHEVLFAGSSLPSGIYICQLKAGRLSRNIKLVLAK
ncbi:MAG: hypothetical protein A2293_04610 [Elusimicrobia bacterium RIFOXYB2_FULL_49_7]|nr:MAG: hypothetical protein A2293_04610 [Elusimicrobia bacterium RIFOXYB2_FULL_49_7]